MSKNILQKCVTEAGLSSAQFNAIWERVKIRTSAKPKNALSGYNFFSKEARKTNKKISMKEIANKWSALSDKKKKKYNAKSVKDKERYVKEMANYEQKMQDSITPEIKRKMELTKLKVLIDNPKI